MVPSEMTERYSYGERVIETGVTYRDFRQFAVTSRIKRPDQVTGSSDRVASGPVLVYRAGVHPKEPLMPAAASNIRSHFDGRSPNVRAIYDRLLETTRAFGPVREEPKMTSIHLAHRTAFAGIATRRDALILTIKSAKDLRSKRIAKREQASANRWHLDVRLEEPAQVDAELRTWLRAAFELAG